VPLALPGATELAPLPTVDADAPGLAALPPVPTDVLVWPEPVVVVDIANTAAMTPVANQPVAIY
jgi:hypothetical protein